MEVEVEYNYEAEQSDELTIKVGDIIKNVTMSEGGWWEGELHGKKGMFPDNFVKVIKKDEGKKKDVQATKRQSVKDLANKLKGQVHEAGPPLLRRKDPAGKKKRAKVVFSYEPENDDELKLEVGDTLDVLKQEEEGWWEGILNGKQGMFPSNFVEVVDESEAADNTDKIENTEEQLIKGKKVQGVGLGNIFGDGPIKLRSTGGKKPGDKPQEPPKAEKREDPVQRRLRGFEAVPEDLSTDINHKTQTTNISAQNIAKAHQNFEDIDSVDTDKRFVDNADTDIRVVDNADLHALDDMLVRESDSDLMENCDISSGDFECIDHKSIEIKPVYEVSDTDSSSESCADIDYNNNRGPEVEIPPSKSYQKACMQEEKWKIGQEKVGYRQKLSSTEYSESLQTILDDLDESLDKAFETSKDKIVTEASVGDKETGFGDTGSSAVKIVPETPSDSKKRLQSLSCWKHTMLTPPERLSFCSAIDSVLVTKKRLIDSAENYQNQTPFHQNVGHFEHAARALNYAAGDLGASGFMKFSAVTDANGSTVIVAKPIDSCHEKSKETDVTVTPSGKDKMPGSPKTYFASLNKSGNLSPFIKSIADKYKLFHPPKLHFKQLNAGDFQENDIEESYAIGMLRHQPECSNDLPQRKSDISLNNTRDLADPFVNQMVNNYVYDVITSGHAKVESDAEDVEDELLTGLNGYTRQEDDVSMAVCVDENSVRIVNSKEDLDNYSVEKTDSSTLLCMTEGCDNTVSEFFSEPIDSYQNNLLAKKILVSEDDPDMYPNESEINREHDLSLPPIVRVEVNSTEGSNSSKMHKKLYHKFKSHSSITHKLPDSGVVRKTSSYCRVPFTSNAPSFWFSKDFSESPKPKSGALTRMRSPKRTSSEISRPVPTLFEIAEKSHLDEFRAKMQAFKVEHDDLMNVSPYLCENRSPAKKKRKKSSIQAVTDYNSRHTDLAENTNWNALILFPTEDTSSSIKTFFPSRCDSQDGDTSVALGTSNIIASPGNLDLQQSKTSNSGMEEEESDSGIDYPTKRPLTYAPKCKKVMCPFDFSLKIDDPPVLDLTDYSEKKKYSLPKMTTQESSNCPVQLLKFRKLDEEFHPQTTVDKKPTDKDKKEVSKRSKKNVDIFSFFEEYTKSTLEGEKKIFEKKNNRTKSSDKVVDSCIENEENAVSVYFRNEDLGKMFSDGNDLQTKNRQRPLRIENIEENLPGEKVKSNMLVPECEVEKSTVSSCFGNERGFNELITIEKKANPVKVSKDFLLLSSLGIRRLEGQENVRNAVENHIKVTDEVLDGDNDVTALMESRNSLYGAISKAVQSYSGISEREKCITVEKIEVSTDTERKDSIEKEDSRIEDRYNITPDVDALSNDLQDLDLSDTPKYATYKDDDNEMHAFLREALGSLDDVMTGSFTSIGSPDGEEVIPKEVSSQEIEEMNDTVEIKDDSILNVVGKKCVLHESEEVCQNDLQEDDLDVCVEVCDDPVLSVIGKKCIIHEVDQSYDTDDFLFDAGKADRLIDIDEDITEDSFDRSLIDKTTQSSPQEKNNSTQTVVHTSVQTSVDISTQTEFDAANEESAVKNDTTVSSKDSCSLTVDYDEAYDIDGNQIDDRKAAVALDHYKVYERQPTYICASPVVGYYYTESVLKDMVSEGDTVENDDVNDFYQVDTDESYDEYDDEHFKYVDSSGQRQEKPLCESSPLVDMTSKIQLEQPDDYYNETSFENPDINFDLVTSPYPEDSEGELDQTRGSSLDLDLDAEKEESETSGEDEEQENKNRDDSYFVEDIQERMQDSGKWLEEFIKSSADSTYNDDEDRAHKQESVLTDNVPAEFEEKVSSYPKTKQTEKAIVRYSYAAENEDELTLNEGEVVTVLEKELEDSGWWKGELNGKIGVFPDNFVEIMKEEPNKGPQPLITPAPQPKPKKPPPPTQAPVIKAAPKLPEKAPVTEPAKEEKPATQPAITAKKPIHPPPPLSKKPVKPVDAVNKEEKKEEPKTNSGHGFEAVETPSDKLTHLTASRPRGPAKRPPSQVFVQNPKTSDTPIKEEERNGDVKEQHWIKEEKPHVGHSHQTTHTTTHHHAKPDKTTEEVPGKLHTVPARPPEPSAATTSLQLAIDELKKEIHEVKANTVSKTVFNELKAENERLRQELDSVKSNFSRQMRNLLTEVDEEKKIRLSTQVEIDRIRKLVAESHV